MSDKKFPAGVLTGDKGGQLFAYAKEKGFAIPLTLIQGRS